MRKGVILLSIIIGMVYIPLVHANELARVMVRFDRSQANTATTGLVCAKPVTTAVEQLIAVQFPTGFSVSGNVNNWTVTTDELPSGAIAWPGINQATVVSGQTVTFPSNDLSVGQLYCFRWTNSAALITGTNGDTIGKLTTKDESNTPIDSSQFAITIHTNDQLSVSGTVPAKPSDVEFSVNTPQNLTQVFKENDQIQFTVHYRSLLTTTAPFRIEASWTEGLINDSGSNYIDALEYVIGSASTSPEGTVPIIDLQNRTIVWDIHSLPPSNNESTVTFKLKVHSTLASRLQLTSTVSVLGKIQVTYLPSIDNNVLIKAALPPIYPSATPASAKLTATLTPTPSIIPRPSFESININSIADNIAAFLIKTAADTQVTIRYGTSFNSLLTTLQDATFGTSHLITINNLKENTTYYLVFTVVDKNQRTRTSDIYTFTTARKVGIIMVSKNDISISSNAILLADNQTKSIVIPQNEAISLTIKKYSSETISQMVASFRNTSVLGINNFEAPPPVSEVHLIETLPGIFTGEIFAPNVVGTYELILKLNDTSGGFFTQTLPYKIHVSTPITVINAQSKEPIENAHITIWKYNSQSRLYTRLDTSFSLDTNTNDHGELTTALPYGIYSLEVTAPGYKKVTKQFTLGINDSSYPVVYMDGSSVLADKIDYIIHSLDNTLTYIFNAIKNFFTSIITRDAMVAVLLVGTLLLTIATLSLRLNTSIFGVFSFLIHSIFRGLERFTHWHKTYGSMYVTESNNHRRTIAGVHISISSHDKTVLWTTRTDLSGRATIPHDIVNHNKYPLMISLKRKGFKDMKTSLTSETIQLPFIHLTMKNTTFNKKSVAGFIEWFSEISFLFLSDFFVLLSVVFTILFIHYLGFSQTVPLISLTTYITLLWLLYVKKVWEVYVSLD